ncbi:helix-turn-helix domain-containing protein [Deinococcus aquaticus]
MISLCTSSGGMLSVSITHRQLSEITGMSISTISKSIVRLAQAGLITY